MVLGAWVGVTSSQRPKLYCLMKCDMNKKPKSMKFLEFRFSYCLFLIQINLTGEGLFYTPFSFSKLCRSRGLWRCGYGQVLCLGCVQFRLSPVHLFRYLCLSRRV